jgi:hypothetical protein
MVKPTLAPAVAAPAPAASSPAQPKPAAATPAKVEAPRAERAKPVERERPAEREKPPESRRVAEEGRTEDKRGSESAIDLLDRADRALRAGRLYGKSDSAVELLLAARRAGASRGTMKPLEDKAARELVAKGRRHASNSDWEVTKATAEAALRIRPDYADARSMLREAESRLKK